MFDISCNKQEARDRDSWVKGSRFIETLFKSLVHLLRFRLEIERIKIENDGK